MFFYYLFIYPLSRLPLRALYFISGGMYILVYKLIGYRKKVVLENLTKSFPDKSPQDIQRLCDRFYRHFCDLVVEAIKSFSKNDTWAKKAVRVINPELVNHYTKKGRKVILVSGHYGNWEISAFSTPAALTHPVHGIYTPLSNPFLNEKIKASRSKAGVIFVHPKSVDALFKEKSNEAFSIIFLADQCPSNPYKSYWMQFLNRETPIFFGVEHYAKKYDCVVIFGKVIKTSRGQYDIHCELLTEYPNKESYGAITEAHAKKLETVIRETPEYWLWTHRRWKRKKPADYIPPNT